MAGSRGSRTARKKKLVRRQQQQQLASGWTENKVRVLSSEVILERLASLGIVTAADEFVEQARTEHAASTIAAQWRERLAVSRQGVDDDFIDLAARVLWDRLLPERPSFEMLDERMQAGYAAFWANDVVRACDEWLAVWEGFKPHLGPEMTRVRDVDALFHGSEYFFNWCQEFENELGNAGVHDPRYWRARIQYVNEFLRQFSGQRSPTGSRASGVALPAARAKYLSDLRRQRSQLVCGSRVETLGLCGFVVFVRFDGFVPSLAFAGNTWVCTVGAGV
jgi:hypothetical protein